MTKARTEAQKRRDKKARDMPDVAPVKRAKKRGRARMADIADTMVGADVETLETRARHAGQDIVRIDTAERDKAKRKDQRDRRNAQLRDMRAPWRGCEAGRSMASVVADEAARADMWKAIMHIRRTQAAYDRAVGAPHRHAQCLRLLLPLDEMHADAASPAIDMRTDREKQDQAVRSWMQVHGWLGYTDKASASICRQTVIDDVRCVNAAALVRALHCVVDGLAGRRMLYRGA